MLRTDRAGRWRRCCACEAKVSQLVDYGSRDCWCTFNTPSSWVLFKSRRVCLSHYRIKSSGSRDGNLFSRVLEVTDDGSTWEVVDEWNTHDLSESYVVQTYECSKRFDRLVRALRLRQTGKNSMGHDNLCLSEIEFFEKIVK